MVILSLRDCEKNNFIYIFFFNMSVNVNFVGRLGRDAEKHESKSNGSFVTYPIAVDEYNAETKQTDTSWIRVIDWTERTLNMLQYLKKGTLIQVQGMEKVSIYQGQNGPQISRDVRAFNWEFVRSGKKEDEQTTTATAPQAQTAPTPPTPNPQQTATTGTFVPPALSTTSAASSATDDLPF